LEYISWNNKKSQFLEKGFHVKGEKRQKGQKENQRTKVEGRRSLELRGCRINSGKGGLSSINGYYGMICTG
jgi:hypothetical protein